MESSKLQGAILSILILSSALLGQASKSQGRSMEPESAKIKELEKRINELSFQLWKLENSERSVEFDPTSASGFLKLKSNNGDFLISLKNVEPYLDGVKVTLVIGNLYSAQFNGFKLNLQWGPRMTTNGDWPTWFGSLNKKSISFTNSLYPGSWNTITFTLAPAKPDAFGYLSIAMENDQLSLKTSLP